MTPKPELNETLRQEYADLFARAAIRPENAAALTAVTDRLTRPDHWARYQAVATATAVPAHVVGILHTLEASGNFACHLHNGDPLTARTVHVPSGRPPVGEPPFSWEESAVDALTLHHLSQWSDWSIPGIAYVLEGYNGWGYRRYHPQVKSPYLWGATTISTAGKYIADGTWSETAVSRQLGGMAILARLIAIGRVRPDGRPAAPGEAIAPPAWDGRILRTGATGPEVLALQGRLRELGIDAAGRTDGKFGPKTARAVRLFQARTSARGGTPLRVDGLVGQKTWQALFAPATAGSVLALPGLSGAGTAPAAARPWFQDGCPRRPLWSDTGI